MFLEIFGAAWGLPWIKASTNAAAVFSDPLCKNVFSIVFPIGIVLTVGVEGNWFMHEIADQLSPQKKAAAELIYGRHKSFSKMFKKIAPILFSTFACISPVYAAVKYNSGIERFFSIITLVGNGGFGYFGYERLIERLYYQFEKAAKSKSMSSNSFRLRLIDGINSFLQQKETPAHLDNIKDAVSFMNFFLGNNRIIHGGDLQKQSCCNLKKILRWSCVLAILPTSSIIEVFLAKEFFENNIWNNSVFAIGMGVLADIPRLVLNTVSTYNMFGRLLNLLFCDTAENKSTSQLVLTSKNKYMTALICSITLLAPTAASYIAYTTLTEEHLNAWMVLFAASAIGAVRVIFSNYALTNLTNRLVSSVYHKSTCCCSIDIGKRKSIIDREKLQSFLALLERSDDENLKPIMEKL